MLHQQQAETGLSVKVAGAIRSCAAVLLILGLASPSLADDPFQSFLDAWPEEGLPSFEQKAPAGAAPPSARPVQPAAPYGVPNQYAQPSAPGRPVPQGKPSVAATDFPAVLKAVRKLSLEGWQASLPVVSTGLSDEHDPWLSPMAVSLLAEFRLRSTITCTFTRGLRALIVKVFRFASSSEAYGAYSSLRQGASNVVGRGDASSEDDASVCFWKDKYFVLVRQTEADDDESKELIRQLADQIAQAIPNSGTVPPIVASLPALDRVLGTERLIMGPVAARKFSPIPYIGLLRLDKTAGAAVADYQYHQSRERLKLLVVDYGDYQFAQDVWRQYMEQLGASHDMTEANGANLFKVSDSLMLCEQRGTRLAIVSGARTKLSPLMLARQVSFGQQ